MKKIGLALIFGLIIFCCSACSVNLNINTDHRSEKTEAVGQTSEPTDTTEKLFNEETANANLSNKDEWNAFYGVWCIGSKSESDAEEFALELSNKGFEAQVIVTTDWENLNPEKFYVVTAGVCKTKEEAEQLLVRVKSEGYSDAYVKYTGKRK